jgi:hypothetical protein
MKSLYPIVFAIGLLCMAPGGATWPPAKGWPPKGSTIASGATVDLSTATSGRLSVSGSGTITSFGTVAAGNVFTLEFTGASGITYNGTSMILLSGASVINKAGTVRVFESLGSGNWQELFNNVASTVTIAHGSTALGTTLITSGNCATVITVSAPGVLTTDVINISPNSDWSGITGYGKATTDTLKILPYPTTDNVNLLVCNQGSASVTPGAATANWNVTR